MRLAAAAALAALLGSCLVAAQAPVNVQGYNCPYTCGPPKCYCASNDVPGGLAPSDVPQFVVLTNDDAITVTSKPTILDITNAYTNRKNGCNIPFTWFVSINYTDPALVQEVYMQSHEIATHTMNHVSNPGVAEIVNAKLWLNQTAHVPLEKIKGFRAPFLVHNNDQRNILQANGFLYDSSIPEMYPTATSPGPDKRLWPYTMDYGLPQRCDLGTGTCSVNETHPGLWEFPMWDIQDENGKMVAPMDPPGDLYEIYKREFDQRYNGNRSPLGVYIHAARLLEDTTGARTQQLKQFIEYASGFDNVWFATVTQVIEWMKNPVPASDYNYNKGCKPPTDMWFASGSFCKKVTCVNGNWSDVTCQCTCAGQFLENQPGFCPDPETGACTVVKEFKQDDRTYYCPGDPNNVNTAPEEPVAAAPVNPYEQAQTATCGHNMLEYNGLGISSTDGDISLSYAEAMKAVDGACTTCLVADAPDANYFMVSLPEPRKLTGVYVVSNTELKGAFIMAGNSTDGGGIYNPPCATNVDIAASTPSIINCNHTASVITLAVPGTLRLCDLYPLDEVNSYIDPSYVQLPEVYVPPSPSPAPLMGRKLKRFD